MIAEASQRQREDCFAHRTAPHRRCPQRMSGPREPSARLYTSASVAQ